MTNDIKKAIEEEARKYISDELEKRRYINFHGTDCVDEAFKHGANFILSKWEESTRWRKVEEELPERRDKPYYILVKDEVTDTIDVHIVYPETEFRYLRDYTHWKPIH